jgi:hypothetical protein
MLLISLPAQTATGARYRVELEVAAFDDQRREIVGLGRLEIVAVSNWRATQDNEPAIARPKRRA